MALLHGIKFVSLTSDSVGLNLDNVPKYAYLHMLYTVPNGSTYVFQYQ